MLIWNGPRKNVLDIFREHWLCSQVWYLRLRWNWHITQWVCSLTDGFAPCWLLAFTTVIPWLIFFTHVFGGTEVEQSVWWRDHLNSIVNFSTAALVSDWSEHESLGALLPQSWFRKGLQWEHSQLMRIPELKRWRELKTPMWSSGFLLH